MRPLAVAVGILLSLAAGRAPTGVQDSPPPTQATRPTTSQPTSGPTTKPARYPFNDDFEIAASGKLPAGWTSKHPDNVRLVDFGVQYGRVVEMTGGEKLMASYGVDLTSGKIPVKPNTRYRCTGYTKSDGPKMIVFVKGYATVRRRVEGKLTPLEDAVYQIRKDVDPTEDWQPFNLDFEILPARLFSDFQHKIEYLRITLWAYWPVGTCWFDDICFEEVAPLPDQQQRHGESVTHVGLPPRLSKAATQPAGSAGDDFDEQQCWRDAVNALRTGDHEQAARLAERLLVRAPHNGAYRVLAARALAALKRWKAAERHARWLLEESDPSDANATPARQIEPWQRDWARVVQAQVWHHTGRRAEAHARLNELLKGDVSPHARAAAKGLLSEIEDGDK